jgi:subtilase family serine protease
MVELKNSIDEIKAGNVKQLELLLDFNSLRQQAGNKPLAIIANADLGNAVAESIEINNKLTQPIPAGLLADLKVKEIQVKEDLKQVRVNVRNFGEAKASEFNLRLQLLRGQTGSLQGVVQDGTKVVGSLEAGSSTDVVFDIDVAAAKQQSSSLPLVLRATADPQNVVPEKDEKNNGFEQIVTQVAVLPELPDLTISSMKTFFNENTVKAVVKNTGNTNAPIAKNIKVSVQFVALPGTEAETILTKTEVLVNQLPSGESTTQAIFADFAAAQQKFKDFIGTGSGKFILRVVVDADNTISEKNESNNRSEEVDITPL